MAFNREDVFARPESGGETMDELFRLLSTAKDNSLQDLLNAINNRRTESVSDVVARYREETGLDLVLSENETTIKTATIKPRFISKRAQAAETLHPILDNADACKDIESYCSCSGGHKSLHAIILALREKLGREDLSYTDPALVKFIEDCKAQHQQTCPAPHTFEAGQVGIQKDDHSQDQVADYFRNSR